MPSRPARTVVLAVALSVAVAVAGCGGDDGDGTAASTTATSAAASSSTGAPVGSVVQVVVAGGTAHGPTEVEVATGDQVTVRVTSDIADEVHVHGYDLTAAVEAGGTAELTFTADRPGEYQVELEAAGLPLFELRVA
jgi:plastocyanin